MVNGKSHARAGMVLFVNFDLTCLIPQAELQRFYDFLFRPATVWDVMNSKFAIKLKFTEFFKSKPMEVCRFLVVKIIYHQQSVAMFS